MRTPPTRSRTARPPATYDGKTEPIHKLGWQQALASILGLEDLVAAGGTEPSQGLRRRPPPRPYHY